MDTLSHAWHRAAERSVFPSARVCASVYPRRHLRTRSVVEAINLTYGTARPLSSFFRLSGSVLHTIRLGYPFNNRLAAKLGLRFGAVPLLRPSAAPTARALWFLPRQSLPEKPRYYWETTRSRLQDREAHKERDALKYDVPLKRSVNVGLLIDGSRPLPRAAPIRAASEANRHAHSRTPGIYVRGKAL